MSAENSSHIATSDTVIAAYFEAMRQGADGIEDLLALFHPDGEYTEPFGGEPRTHRGVDEIRTCLTTSMAQRPPGLVLHVHRVDIDGAAANAKWSCEADVFPAPVCGSDRYEIEGGRIRSLVTEILS